MAWYDGDDGEGILKFVVIGDIRSGLGLMQELLASHSMVVCHRDNFHPLASVRRSAHEAYFGQSPPGAIDWFEPTEISVNSYITHKIFGRTANNERAVGVVVPYNTCESGELWDYLRVWRGDVCVIHVTRNPVACLVATKQAEKYGEDCEYMPAAYVEPDELIEYVRSRQAICLRLSRACSDRIVVPYQELLLDAETVRWNLFQFMGLPDEPSITVSRRKPKNRNMRRRLSNYTSLQQTLPADVLEHLNSPTFF